MSSTTRTRQRSETAPELDPVFDSRLDLELAETERDAALDGVPGAPREPGLRRYLRWQALDFLKQRAVFLLPLAIVVLCIFRVQWNDILLDGMRGDSGNSSVTAVFDMIVSIITLVGGAASAILSTHGIVSRDRERGHQRFLFAKPVRMTSFYLQAFLVNGVGTLAVIAIMLGLTSLVFLRPVPFFIPMLGAAVTYAAVGGLTFLLSTLVRFELAVAGVLTLLSVALRAASESGRWWAPAAYAFSWLLPPVHYIEAFAREAQPRIGRPGVVEGVIAMLGYGAAYVTAGIAVLKRRSILR